MKRLNATYLRSLFWHCRSYGIATAFMAVWPSTAECGVGPSQGGFFWMLPWVGLLVVVAVVLGYLQQSRMVQNKTAELRRELFERQTAEKELLNADQQLRQSLAEKESLLKEIHHRVKNNLQIVSSLLYLQEDYMADPKGAELLRESQNRVKSMALIHEQLYGSKDLAIIDFDLYVRQLTSNLVDAYGIDPAHIQLHVHSDGIVLGVDMAVPCGLIINELVSNALKHAFPRTSAGTITVTIRRLGAERLEIVVADDGIGLAARAEEIQKKSLGLRLVDTLTNQLDGTLNIDTRSGTRFSITANAPDQPNKEC